MEPLSIGIGTLAWEYGVKPALDSAKKEYGEEAKKLIKSGLSKVWQKLPFTKQEQEVIEAEIVDIDVEVLSDEKKFLEFIQNNNQIQELMTEVTKREPNINIVIEKSYNEILIDGSNNSITF